MLERSAGSWFKDWGNLVGSALVRGTCMDLGEHGGHATVLEKQHQADGHAVTLMATNVRLLGGRGACPSVDVGQPHTSHLCQDNGLAAKTFQGCRA